ncbi:MAG: uracil-DNA glycosylase family protein [bacterium]
MTESDTLFNAWRQLRTHLESLRRAGLIDIPVSEWSGPAFEFAVEQPPEVAKPDTTRPRPAPVQVSQPPVDKPTEPRISGQAAKPETQPAKEIRPAAAASRPSSEMLIPGIKPPGIPAERTVKPETTRQFQTITSMFDKSRKAFETPVTPPDQRLPILQQLANEVAECTRCAHLAATRTQTVFADGNINARLMFIGEAPGADEDEQGVPFVGRAGKLLTDIITLGMGLDRQQVYIANVLKCRPPENRTPVETEIDNCMRFLDKQIEIVRPEFICLLGKTAAGAILQTALPMKNLRLRWYRYKGIPVMVTYHPSYLLRNPPAKKETWEDLKFLMTEMGIKPPARE